MRQPVAFTVILCETPDITHPHFATIVIAAGIAFAVRYIAAHDTGVRPFGQRLPSLLLTRLYMCASETRIAVIAVAVSAFNPTHPAVAYGTRDYVVHFLFWGHHIPETVFFITLPNPSLRGHHGGWRYRNHFTYKAHTDTVINSSDK